jgi:hypothetical protein
MSSISMPVYLRIANSRIRPLLPSNALQPQLVSTEPADEDAEGHLYVLEADLTDLSSYARPVGEGSVR